MAGPPIDRRLSNGDEGMPQVFGPSANTISRLVLMSIAIGGPGLLVLNYLLLKSPYQTQVRVIQEQPVPFSHEHHVRGLGIDCRYCHTSVETSAFAGMPPTHTCMSCHSQIWFQSPLLEPVRASLSNNRPLAWTRLHDLPDFVYFHHAIHVQKGVACAECHGRVELMPQAWRAEPLTMEWCLECHRDPGPRIRPREAVFLMDWPRSSSEPSINGDKLVQMNHAEVEQLTNCSICHR
jgi:hypothetical protein